MRVLQVITAVDEVSSYGGPLTVALMQCHELQRLGHEVTIAGGWTPSVPPPADLEGIPARLFPARRVLPLGPFAGLFSPRLARWLLGHVRSFDVVHFHLGRELVVVTAAAIAKRRSVPYVTQTHGMIGPDRRMTARLLDVAAVRPVLRGAGSCFVLSNEEQETLDRAVPGRLPVRRLNNGIRISDDVQTDDPSPPEVLFLARLHPRKRVLAFARAAQELLAEGVDARFSIIGADGGDLAALTSYLEEAGSPDRLAYEGALPHREAISRLARCSVYVLPSVHEPYPMSAIEALALGKPTVVTSTNGLAALPELDAILSTVDPDSQVQLADSIRKLVASRELRVQTGNAAANTARELFSMQSVGEVLVGAYRDAAVDSDRAPQLAAVR